MKQFQKKLLVWKFYNLFERSTLILLFKLKLYWIVLKYYSVVEMSQCLFSSAKISTSNDLQVSIVFH